MYIKHIFKSIAIQGKVLLNARGWSELVGVENWDHT